MKANCNNLYLYIGRSTLCHDGGESHSGMGTAELPRGVLSEARGLATIRRPDSKARAGHLDQATEKGSLDLARS